MERWKKLPYLMNFQDPGEPKPGAVVLVDVASASRAARLPLLIIQNFGRGRTAVFATGGSWRWQMLQPVADKSHEMFYTQLLRWLVNDTPRRDWLDAEAGAGRRIERQAARRSSRSHLSAGGRRDGGSAHPGAGRHRGNGRDAARAAGAGCIRRDWTTPKPGSYLVEVMAKRGTEEIGRDVLTFRREDGVAENFHVEQNRELLEKLSSETGGRYYKPEDAQKLGKDINYSEAGITVRETRDLWDMPVVFLLLLMLRRRMAAAPEVGCDMKSAANARE